MIAQRFDPLTDLEIPARLWCAWTEDGKRRMIRRGIGAAERAALEERELLLSATLAPFHPDELDGAAAEVAQMLGAFRSAREQGGDAVATIAGLVGGEGVTGSLAQFPLWAIRKACLRMRTDGYDVEDRGVVRRERHWAPSDPEVAREVRKEIAAMGETLGMIRSLLNAEVEPPAPELAAAPARPAAEPWDGKHMERVAADLEARKQARGDVPLEG